MVAFTGVCKPDIIIKPRRRCQVAIPFNDIQTLI